MKNRTTFSLVFLVATIFTVTTYRYAFAGDTDPPGHINHHGFGASPCLVAFDLGGANGVEQTVLVDASITDIGGKRFLGGTVTDKYPEVKVAFPGTLAFVALERIAYIKILDSAKPQEGG